MISPLAYVSPKAQIGKDVTIDPFAYIDDNVIIGDNCHIFPHATIGCIPQDLKFHGEETWTIIGNNCNIREFVTVHRGTFSKGKTVIGNNNLIMAYCHVAHDCELGNNIIMSNATQLAGEVVVDDFAIIGGGTLVHQFSHIGSHVMVQGGSRINKDIPPYSLCGRDPISFAGVNIVGLRRRGFSSEQIREIKDMYDMIYNSGMNVSDACAKIEIGFAPSEEKDTILKFINGSKRGIVRGIGTGSKGDLD